MRTILRDNYTPEMGAYHEVLIIDEIRHKKYLFDCDGVFTDITNPLVISERGSSEDFAASQKWVTDVDDKVDGLAEDLGDEIQARTDADDAIWAEIEEIEMSSDVVDIVGTYAELQQYDTSKLHDNDIIKVLRDETHQNETAYYRWSIATETFSYVGSEGPYYTESEVDALLAGKQDVLIAGANIQIAADGKTISATDTTYSDFTGATSQEDGTHGLVPGPLAGDEGKFLQGDGSWGTPTDTTYTAGTGLDLTGTEFSVDTTAIQEKLTAGSNVQINDNVISATDTTYTHFTGATSVTDGVQGLVPAPIAGDEGKYLKADGTWDEAGTNYTAGNGISITNDEISVDDTYVQKKLTAGANIQISANDEISATDTTYSDFTGATSSTAGTAGLVPAPASGEMDKYLKSDGTWATVSQYSLPAATASTLGGVKIGANLSMDSNDVLSATDTTYSNFVGTDGQTAGTAGLVPAPATTDAGKFLKADGTWDDAGSPINVVQTTGTSTADVMSQNATTSMVFADPGTKQKVQLGNASSSLGAWGVAIGYSSRATNSASVGIGYNANASGNGGIAILGNSSASNTIGIGYNATASAAGAIALGSNSSSSVQGQMSIGTSNTGQGYNSSNYRLLTGLYDPQSAHDAATKGYVDGKILTNAGAPTTSTAGTVGQLLQDSTNGKLYICTDATDPYVWEEVGSGGGAEAFTTNEWEALWA